MDLHHGNHADHLHQQHHSTPPPPTHKPSAEAEEEKDAKPLPLLPLSVPNGTLKKHRRQETPPLSWSRPCVRERRKNHVVYRECMKNHAAPLGGHALDGCGEFMPSPGSNPFEPASLTCAACGCHRNFHRRLLHSVERGEAGPEVEDGDAEGRSLSPPPPRQGAGFNQYSASAPHMLMALSTAGFHGGPVGTSGSPQVTAGTTSAGTAPGMVSKTFPAKRFRTKFSPEQKGMMQDLCERLGWRMQRRDDALVEQRCREIGVSRGVFKVWMHNNKHAFVGGPSSRRGGGGCVGGGGTGETTTCGQGGGGGGAGGCAGTGAGGEGVSVNGNSGNAGASGHALNCSPVSS